MHFSIPSQPSPPPALQTRTRSGTEEDLRQQLAAQAQGHKRELARKALQSEQLFKDYNALQAKYKALEEGRGRTVSTGNCGVMPYASPQP